MFHMKEEYMKFVSAGYMAADPKNRQEVFGDGDHISGNSLEPGGWSLENDIGARVQAWSRLDSQVVLLEHRLRICSPTSDEEVP
jgi:hypothetical protein